MLTGMLAARPAKRLTEKCSNCAAEATRRDCRTTGQRAHWPSRGIAYSERRSGEIGRLVEHNCEEKMTVPQIKAKSKPIVDLLKAKPAMSKALSSTSPAAPTTPPRPTPAPALTAPKATPASMASLRSRVDPSTQLHQARQFAALEDILRQVGRALEQLQAAPGGLGGLQTLGTMAQHFELDANSDAQMGVPSELSPTDCKLREDAALSWSRSTRRSWRPSMGSLQC